MRNILTITARELKAYFVSPLAYIIIAAVTAVLGFAYLTPESGAAEERLIAALAAGEEAAVPCSQANPGGADLGPAAGDPHRLVKAYWPEPTSNRA